MRIDCVGAAPALADLNMTSQEVYEPVVPVVICGVNEVVAEYTPCWTA